MQYLSFALAYCGKGVGMNSSKEKELGAEALNSFLNQFGEPDAHTNLVLEIIFREMLGVKKHAEKTKPEKTVSLPSEERQEGD